MPEPDAVIVDGPVIVHGAVIDGQTRCVHYRGPTDVVAIRFRCCDRWYPCLHCHADVADHPVLRWPRAEWGLPAVVLCGVCRGRLTVADYLNSGGDGAPYCPRCGAGFNPGCAAHHRYYFETEATDRADLPMTAPEPERLPGSSRSGLPSPRLS